MAALRGKALIAYLLVCTVWGSTYLAIRIGVGHLPPLLFAGVRFLVAGAAPRHHRAAPGRPAARAARATGGPSRSPALFLLVRRQRDRGLVGAVRRIGRRPACSWRRCRSGRRSSTRWCPAARPRSPGGWASAWPSASSAARCSPGSRPRELLDRRPPRARSRSPSRSASWALGSVYWKRHPTEASPYSAAAVQMAIGGAVLTLARPRARRSDRRFTSTGAGLGAMAYLVVFGSIVGYTAYGYALRARSATIVGTYAYVNPVVAVAARLAGAARGGHRADAGGDGAHPGRGAVDPARHPAGAAAAPAEPRARSPAPGGGRMTAPVAVGSPLRRCGARSMRVVTGFEELHAVARRVDPPGAPDGRRCGTPAATSRPRRSTAVRTGILGLNAAHGRAHHAHAAAITRRSPASTCAWSEGSCSRRAGRAIWRVRANRLVERYGDRELPLRYYSEARLMSPEARAGGSSRTWPPCPERTTGRPLGLPVRRSVTRGSAGQQMPPELGQPPAHRAVVDPLAHPHDARRRESPDRPRTRRCTSLPSCRLSACWMLRCSASSAGRASVTPARTRLSLMSSSAEVLGGDLAQQLLPAALHHRLQEQHELPRRVAAGPRRAAAPSRPWAPAAT